MAQRTEEERVKRRRKRAARVIQAANPGMKYIVAWRQVVEAEEKQAASEKDMCPHGLLGKDSCW